MTDGPTSELVVRVYGDSLSLPRVQDGIGHRDTYPELVVDGIRHCFPGLSVSLYNRSGGGMTINALYERYLHDCSYFGNSSGQVLIVQCGIVDCAPRPIPAAIRNLISKLPSPIRATVIGFLHRARPHLLKAGLSWRLTTPKHFARLLSRWLSHAADTFERVYVVNIAPTVPTVAAHSPGLADSITVYNELIRESIAACPLRSVVLVEINAAITEAERGTSYVNGADGHHITREGHKLYSHLILSHELARLGRRSGDSSA